MKKSYLIPLLGIIVGIWGVAQIRPIKALQIAVEPSPTPSPTIVPSPSPSPTIVPSPSPSPEETTDDKLKKLEELLKAKNWEEADDLSYKVMLEIAGPKSQKEGRFVTGEWEEFSCSNLKKINEMWSQASDEKFGFRTQKEVFESESVNEDPKKYYEAIGWIKNNTNLWLVEWEYKKGKGVFYTKKPNFTLPLSEYLPGYLPGKLKWDDNKDHRFDMVNACDL